VTEELDIHFNTVVAQIKQGKVIPFLGAGANLASRPEGEDWDPQSHQFLPNGSELARYLADRHQYAFEDRDNLVRVAEYVSLTAGPGALYESLRKLFNADYPLTPLHDLLSGLPRFLQEKGFPPIQLFVTTNYDDILERAFREESIDVLTYMSLERGLFLHVPPKSEGEPQLIKEGEANEYGGFPLDENERLPRPVVLKLHGAVDRVTPDRDSFVITEDDYIQYLVLGDISNLIPATLKAKLVRSNFLFLGYSLRDWNLRAILHRIWSAQKARWNSWAVQHNPDELDEEAWAKRGVQILDIGLDDYVAELKTRLDKLPAAEVPANA
jgi:SIR2-like domain